jgi:hypothetical protein
MKVYLSGPMSGIPQFNVPAFKAATAGLIRLGLTVVSPVELDANDGLSPFVENSPNGDLAELEKLTGYAYGDMLARDIKVLFSGTIDGVVVMQGWAKSKGARLEVMAALLQNIPIAAISPAYDQTVDLPRGLVAGVMLESLL